MIRTVQETKETLFDIPVKEIVSCMYTENKQSESCFYQLGAARVAVYDTLKNHPLPSLLAKKQKNAANQQ